MAKRDKKHRWPVVASGEALAGNLHYGSLNLQVPYDTKCLLVMTPSGSYRYGLYHKRQWLCCIAVPRELNSLGAAYGHFLSVVAPKMHVQQPRLQKKRRSANPYTA